MIFVFTRKIDQVYGSSVHGNRYNVGIHKTQLNYFRLNPRAIHTTTSGFRRAFWMRDILKEDNIAALNADQQPYGYYTKYAGAVRPFILQ